MFNLVARNGDKSISDTDDSKHSLGSFSKRGLGSCSFDVITLGSATRDLFLTFSGELLEGRSLREALGSVDLLKKGDEIYDQFLLLPLGSKLLISSMVLEVGGGGTNTAVGFSRAGFNTGFVGRIGDDESGVAIFKLLKKEGVSFLGSVVKKGRSGFSVILEPSGKEGVNDRVILTNKGVNNGLRFNSRGGFGPFSCSFSSLSSRLVYSSSLIGDSFDFLKRFFIKMKAKGSLLVFNPSSYQVSRPKELKGFLPLLDLLVLNREEAEVLLEGLGGSVVKSPEKLLPALHRFLAPSSWLAVTDGGNGAYLLVPLNNNGLVGSFEDRGGDRSNGFLFFYALPSFSRSVVEVTGAGDAFSTGLVAGLLKGLSPDDALRAGMLSAESVIGFIGAKKGLLSWDELVSRVSNDDRKVFKELF